MLRFRRDRLYIGLEYDRLTLVRLSGSSTGSVGASKAILLDTTSPETASIDALEQELQLPIWQQADSYIVLADRLVRYFVAERPSGARNLEEAQLAACMRFEDLFGTPVSEWDIRVDMHPRTKKQLGCAIKKSIVSALVKTCANAKSPVVSIEPFAISEFNRSHAKIGLRHGWFAVLGRCSLWVGLKHGYDWLSAHQYSLGDDVFAEVSRHLAQENLRAPSETGAHTRDTWITGFLASEQIRSQFATTTARILSAPNWSGQSEPWGIEYRLGLSPVWPACA